jgi:hypothetical protein
MLSPGRLVVTEWRGSVRRWRSPRARGKARLLVRLPARAPGARVSTPRRGPLCRNNSLLPKAAPPGPSPRQRVRRRRRCVRPRIPWRKRRPPPSVGGLRFRPSLRVRPRLQLGASVCGQRASPAGRLSAGRGPLTRCATARGDSAPARSGPHSQAAELQPGLGGEWAGSRPASSCAGVRRVGRLVRLPARAPGARARRDRAIAPLPRWWCPVGRAAVALVNADGLLEGPIDPGPAPIDSLKTAAAVPLSGCMPSSVRSHAVPW